MRNRRSRSSFAAARERSARGVRRQHAETGAAPAAPQVQLADAAGRLSRVLPLYLSEQAQVHNGARVRSLFPWMDNAIGGSFVLTTVAVNDKDAIARRAAAVRWTMWSVTHVKAVKEPWSATIRLLRASDGKRLYEHEAFATQDRPDVIAAQLAIELQRAPRAARGHPGATGGATCRRRRRTSPPTCCGSSSCSRCAARAAPRSARRARDRRGQPAPLPRLPEERHAARAARRRRRPHAQHPAPTWWRSSASACGCCSPSIPSTSRRNRYSRRCWVPDIAAALRRHPHAKWIGIALIAAALVALPLVLATVGTAWVRITNLAILFVMLSLGLNIVVGFAGLLDLGYIAFYAVGAYVYALLAGPHFNIHLPWWVILPIGAAVACSSGCCWARPP
jgi:hypothetical protein